MNLHRFFHPGYAPVYVPAVLSLAGALFYTYGDRLTLLEILSDRWSPHYLFASPFIHGGLLHCLFNVMVLHYIGGGMLLPLVGKRFFIALLVMGVVGGTLANNLLSNTPAIGISSGLMALLGCAVFPYGRAPMKLLLIHDILRLPPFQFRYLIAFVVLLDILGILFGWHFFAHWAHLGGFAVGIAAGYRRFGNRLF